MRGPMLPWRLALGLALLIAASGCTNTLRGAQRDVDNLLAQRRTAPANASASAATTNPSVADEWVDPR